MPRKAGWLRFVCRVKPSRARLVVRGGWWADEGAVAEEALDCLRERFGVEDREAEVLGVLDLFTVVICTTVGFPANTTETILAMSS